MTDVTHILGRIESGDPSAAEQLLPLVYDALRELAAAKMAQEKPGQTLQATALVHEVYIRLVAAEQGYVQRNDSYPTPVDRAQASSACAQLVRLYEKSQQPEKAAAWKEKQKALQ